MAFSGGKVETLKYWPLDSDTTIKLAALLCEAFTSQEASTYGVGKKKQPYTKLFYTCLSTIYR